MPELPEVETFARQIKPQIINKEITAFEVFDKGLRLIAPTPLEEFTRRLIGSRFTSLNRHGKFLILDLANNWHIVAHLRMSGRFTITKTKPDKHIHNRLYIKFADNTILNFIDTRRFATFHLVDDTKKSKSLNNLGPDALSGDWTASLFYQELQKHNKAIYKCLLDQSIISGIGNIYANESLFLANINPDMSANSLTKAKCAKLLINIVDILSTAINFKGTTLLDKSYIDIDGSGGKFAQLLKVYARKGKPCKKCATIINRKKVSGRSVFYCPKCQR